MPIRILKKDKNKSEPKKRFDPRTGEETNKPGGKDPRTIYAPKPQIPPERQMRTGGLSPKQKAIASKAPPPNKITGADFAVLKKEKAKGRGMGLQDESIKPGKVMKARDGKAIKKDPTKPVNPFQKTPKTKSKLPGRIGTALGIGAMMVPAAYAAAKQYKDYKSAKNRDEAKVKKYSLGGDILTQFKDIMTGSKDSKISKAKEGLKKQIAEGRAKMRDKAKVKKYSKGGGADTGKMGEIKSQFAVASDRIRRTKRDGDRLTQRDIDFINKQKQRARKSPERTPGPRGSIPERLSRQDIVFTTDKSFLKDMKPPSGAAPGKFRSGGHYDDKNKNVVKHIRVKKKMGGGMMQRPMGYKSGTMVKARGCKLGRTRPTKIT